MRRLSRWLCAGLALCAFSFAAGAQSYPSKPITLIVPFPAGSTTDLVGRIMASNLSNVIGQTVVVDNRGGAGGIVGTDAVAKAAPDGYTILMGTIGTHSINPAVYPKITYDPITDFAPVIQFGTAPNVLVVNPKLPVKTVAELAAYMRAHPGEVNYGSSGNGTSNHLAGALFASRQQVKAVHVPYKGGADAITSLIRGDIQMMFYHYLPMLAHIAEGTMRPLAITSASRIDALPNVPTMKEASMEDFVVSAWFGVYAPAKTPPAIVAKLHDAIAKVINSPDVKKTLMMQGVDPVSGSSDDLARLTKSEIARWAKTVDEAGARLSN
ncbi:MAG: tripartite tricarboxylate transporter substrate binding protein [Pseudolabrys sp.]|nr:tripartite tricarboxylate transporter substrate binding protein [Pseudolabrys sp.]MBV9262268.1 tripartite tricarboxylate transporter substrate binding protein [Pseudolabrys sp.]